MTRDGKSRRDEDLRELFQAMRNADHREVPLFLPPRWVHEIPETRRTRVRRLAFAGSVAVVVTAALAASLVGWRMLGLSPHDAADSPARVVIVRKYVPPPPKIERRAIVPRQGVARQASGSRSSESNESLQTETQHRLRSLGYVRFEHSREAAPAEEGGAHDGPLPMDAEFLIGVPEPPPAAGPLLAGVSGVTSPERIPESYVEPVYPELARKARMSGKIVLSAVVDDKGEVKDVEVLRVDRPNLGFEESAIEAVKQWRYQPATEDGKPVDVFITVVVDFKFGEEDSAAGDTSQLNLGTESYAAIEDNPFHVAADEPLSTFSVDVDTASYSNVRRFLTERRRPPRDAVRVEELINYFDYDHPVPEGDDPFGVAVEIADCPWNSRHRLARVMLAARRELRHDYRGSNLVFLLDVSGSMEPPKKLPLVKEALSMLADQLDGRDTVSIVVYAGASGLALPPSPGSDRATILDALDRLEAGGSTAGAAGLRLAYKVARENFVEGGVNRVILATDGDFNVGVTSHAELLRIIADDAKRGIFLTALGFGMGNYKDDRLEQLADHGNGNYAYIDGITEARKVLVEEIGGTLVTVAKDVKIQVEFNPLEVGAYRLIGYENRLLAHRDFHDDTKDAGEIGAGHTVTALYELVPPGDVGTEPEVDPSRYQRAGEPTDAALSGELFTLKIRFKGPNEHTSTLRTYPARDDGLMLEAASDDFRFASAVAAFGMRLRESAPVRDFGWDDVEHLAGGALGIDEHGHRTRFLDLVRHAQRTAP